MSTPIDPPPDEIDPSGPAPVWDGKGVRWNWVDDYKAYVCEDPAYTGPSATTPGAIPDDRQPFYGHPPTEFEQALQDQPLED